MESFYKQKGGVRELLAKEKKGLFLGQDISFVRGWTLGKLTAGHSQVTNGRALPA